jgi:hypothetical protein
VKRECLEIIFIQAKFVPRRLGAPPLNLSILNPTSKAHHCLNLFKEPIYISCSSQDSLSLNFEANVENDVEAVFRRGDVSVLSPILLLFS